MKKIIELKLRFFAKLILMKYKPDIIGITGSVGKTTTKEAVYTVLSGAKKVRRSVKNYNNEIGLPLTIIGALSPGKSVFGWISVFLKAFWLLVKKDKDYPEALILEMGVDRPGDMKYLLGIARCRIGIVTMIGKVHAEYFEGENGIAREKGELIKSLGKDGWAILNYDNDGSRKMMNFGKARPITYGLEKGADVGAKEIMFNFESGGRDVVGIRFKLSYKGASEPVLLPKVFGYNAVYSALAAAAAGIIYGMKLDEIAEALGSLSSPPGRMNMINGIKRTLIIDDTYNSEPNSVISALSIFSRMRISEGARKIAVLGDMLELGGMSEEEHRKIGKAVFSSGAHKLITVGERSRDMGRGAVEAGMEKDDIFHFPDPDAAGRFLQERMREGDLVLVKGSQGVRMEKIVKEVMAEPLRAGELLVRQDDQWEK